MANHVQLSHMEKGGEAFCRKEREVWEDKSKQSPWLFTEYGRGKKGSLVFLLGSAVFSGQESSPFWEFSI